MTARYVGLTSTFDEQRLAINDIAQDVDNLLNAGYATTTYVGLATVGLLNSTGNGSSLSGIVTTVTAGSGISINQSTGNVTITSLGGSQTLNQTLGYGNTSSLGISVGISTFFDNKVIVGGATTALIVNGNARITGILTLGTASIELIAQNEHLRVGSGVSIYSAGNAIYSGIITAPSFVGNGSRLTGIVTAITAGAGISVSQSTGDVTITATPAGSGIGTNITGVDGFTYIDQSGKIITSNITFDTTNSGTSNSYILLADKTMIIESGIGVTIGSGKVLLIDAFGLPLP